MDYLSGSSQFSSLSLRDLLQARDQFHPHLMHKANVVGTAVGRYLIRQSDPYPTKTDSEKAPVPLHIQKAARTLENSEVRDYSWPCVLVFVSRWVDAESFGGRAGASAADFIPKTIYLEDGRSVPVCVVEAPAVETAPPPVNLADLTFPDEQLSPGYPILAHVQGADHLASLGCLVTDGHTLYGLTSHHVAGRAGEELFTISEGRKTLIGHTSDKHLSRLPFEKIYEEWPGKHIYLNLDVGLVELADQTRWSPAVYGLGALGPLADLSVYNFTLNLIGCPVRAYGCVSGRLAGRIAALFYRYKAVGGFEYVADFLIGSRDDTPLLTRPGDSGTVWVIESDDVRRDRMPVAVQWGGAVFSGATEARPFALATNLSTICHQLEVDLFRERQLASFEYWGAVGHYTIGALACDLIGDANLSNLILKNRDRISFQPSALNTSVSDVTVPHFVPLADVPDKVWKKIKTSATPYGRRGPENPNHYADIDYAPQGGQSLDSLTPTAAALQPATWRQFYHAAKWNAVSQRGLLPFRVWQIYKAMVGFVSQGDVARFVAAAGVLAHYVGDACQPLHGSYLDDGDPFRNPDGTVAAAMLGHGKGFASGVHVAYEDDMIDGHVFPILSGLPPLLGGNHAMNLVQGGQNAGFATFELMRRTRQQLPPLDIVNAYGQLVLAHQKSQASTVLWQQFGAATLHVMADGCRTLAMLWESAWQEGNGANIPSAQLKPISKQTLQGIYEDQSFLPSVALGQIDPLL